MTFLTFNVEMRKCWLTLSSFAFVFFSVCSLEVLELYSVRGEGLGNCCFYAYAKQPGIEGQG